MKKPVVLVTGASGFVGSFLVKKLSNKDIILRAGNHKINSAKNIEINSQIETIYIDITDYNSVKKAMQGVDFVYHFAALVDSNQTRKQLELVNVLGTKNVWKCAAEYGVKRALYCSSAAVYGLRKSSCSPITESDITRALEPYGNSKLLGESAVLEIAAGTGMHTTIIRPVAIFGPGEHTPFGKKLRDAAVSKLLLAGGFQNKKFNFIHVEDVADASIHLMQADIPSGQIYNITVNEAISFEEAFRDYIRLLGFAGATYKKIRLLAFASHFFNNSPSIVNKIIHKLGARFVFGLWHPGFDMNYSSEKLLQTSYKIKWENFGDVLYSCIRDD